MNRREDNLALFGKALEGCRNGQLRPGDVAVLAVIGRDTDDLGGCDLLVPEIGRALGLGRSTTFNALARLRAVGLVERRADGLLQVRR